MIDSIIFDFGDVFINLDKEATPLALKKLGLKEWNSNLNALNLDFEKGNISEKEFIVGLQSYIPNASINQIREAWNSILLDFPLYRLEFLQMLAQKHKLYLLSNTDSIHIEKFREKSGITFYRDFYKCFEKVYFSFEIGMRKPETSIFEFLIKEHNLLPKNTLFVDDNLENIESAKKLGLQVWHLQKGNEDVIDLFANKII
ncbi:MAG: HAD family phosphatase [Flavobacteriaceae bacterium]|nr:HAD family phosphatase [Flavobacteriaceae bacterium]